MKKSTVTLTILLAFTLACGLITPPVTLTPMPTQTPAPLIHAVRVHLMEVTTTVYEQPIATGATAILETWFEPQLYSPIIEYDGSLQYLFKGAWETPNITEMRLCFSTSSPCQPEGDWLPYTEKKQFPIMVDWLGSREFWVGVEFRDSSGDSILGYDGARDLQAVIQISTQVIGFWNVGTPIANQPASVQTAVAPTLAAFPVIGSVLLEGGNCCTGGKAGSTINLDVEFTAASIYGQVTEMRVSTTGCLSEADMSNVTWEPFAPSKAIPVNVVINWVGFYVSAQYRDDKNNLSPVYCDDISVEGMP
jgi:hypothetical protein